MSMYGMKKEPLVNHVRERSMNLVITLSKILALDEMMIYFLGISHETNERSLYFICFSHTLWLYCRVVTIKGYDSI